MDIPLFFFTTSISVTIKIFLSWGIWVAQSVTHPAPDFGLGHDLWVVGCWALWGVWSLLKVLPLPSMPPPTCAHSLSHKKEKEKTKLLSCGLAICLFGKFALL